MSIFKKFSNLFSNFFLPEKFPRIFYKITRPEVQPTWEYSKKSKKSRQKRNKIEPVVIYYMRIK